MNELRQAHDEKFASASANAGAEQIVKQLIAHCDARLPTPERLDELLRQDKIEPPVDGLDSGLDNVTIEVEPVGGKSITDDELWLRLSLRS